MPVLQHHLKKLEGRRLDFDYKKKRQGKVCEDEIKQALEKFDDSKEIAEQSMFNILEGDVRKTGSTTHNHSHCHYIYTYTLIILYTVHSSSFFHLLISLNRHTMKSALPCRPTLESELMADLFCFVTKNGMKKLEMYKYWKKAKEVHTPRTFM